MAEPDRLALRAVAVVAGVAVIAAALISGSNEISAERILENQRARLLRALHEVLDPSAHDNDLIRNQIFATDVELLGSREPVEVFLASRNGIPVAAIFAAVAPRGYVAPIDLLVGIDAAGAITGVRVTQHRETPGLGDQIEIGKSDWIRGFDGASLSTPPLAEWSVVHDGGHFDGLTSATVSSRALVLAVKNELLHFQQNQEALFSQLRPEEPGEDPGIAP